MTRSVRHLSLSTPEELLLSNCQLVQQLWDNERCASGEGSFLLETKCFTPLCKSVNLRYFRNTLTYRLGIPSYWYPAIQHLTGCVEPSPVAFPIDITISTLIFHGFRVISSLQQLPLGSCLQPLCLVVSLTTADIHGVLFPFQSLQSHYWGYLTTLNRRQMSYFNRCRKKGLIFLYFFHKL